jgi:hypothetical protein
MREQNVTKDIFTTVGLSGPTPFDLQKSTVHPDFIVEADTNIELTKLGSIYAADPFVFIQAGTQYLFFELLLINGKGVIGRAERKNDQDQWSNYKIILEEDFHLSYPFIFSIEGNTYMTVESAEANEIRICKSTDSTLQNWKYEKGLLSGKHYDPTIFHHDDTWYMYTCTELDFSVTNLYYSEGSILGPWIVHPQSPIIKSDSSAARPAGPVLEWESKKYRLAQDCSERYGAAVKAFEIVKLTKQEYLEKEHGVILSSGQSHWNTYGMHHLQIYKVGNDSVLAVSDGYHRI